MEDVHLSRLFSRLLEEVHFAGSPLDQYLQAENARISAVLRRGVGGGLRPPLHCGGLESRGFWPFRRLLGAICSDSSPAMARLFAFFSVALASSCRGS